MRHTAVFGTILLGAFFGASAFAADQELLNLVMPDAQVMAGVNVTTAKISPFGQYLIARISADDKGLQELITKTGFDPRQDVTEILAASAAIPSTPGGLVLAKGNFNPAQIVAAIPSGKNQQVETYAGATLIIGTGPKSSHALAFVGNSIAIGGDLASVKAALDRSTQVNAINPALAAQVQTLSTTEDAWSVSLASLASLLPAAATAGTGGPAERLQLLKNIQSSSAGVKFGADVQVTAQAITDTPQDAAALADVIRLIASLASMGTGHNGQPAPANQLLQNLKVTTDGATVDIAATVPEPQIEALLKTASSHKPASLRDRRM